MDTVYAKTREQLEAELAAATTTEERAQVQFELDAIPNIPDFRDKIYLPDRRSEIIGELSGIDRDSIRPLRAIADGSATDYDRNKLAELDARAVELRAELAGLAK
jgi:hypothetical protein